MTDNTGNDEVVSDYYENYTQTQKEIFAIEIRKTRNTLIIMAIIVFASDLLSLLIANALYVENLLYIIVIPAILVALALLALKEPLLAMIIAVIVVTGIWIYAIVITGGRAAIMGWLIKAIIVYFMIKGFHHAAEANKIKRELKF